MDAAILLPGGRTVAVVRQGLTSDRTGFSKRLWRLREEALTGAVLLLMPDETRLRYARRLLAGSPAPAFLALERDAASAGPADPVWRPPAVNATLDLRSALARIRPGGALPTEPQLSRATLPASDGAGLGIPDYMLPAPLKPAERRALDLLFDWPWISQKDLASLLAVSEPRASQFVTPLEGFGLATRLSAAGRRLALTDRGLAMLARRDRASVGVARRRWSVAPIDPEGPADWRNVSGARSRQLLRNVEHTEAVHAFIAACVACPFQSRSRWVETKRRWPELFAEAVEIDAGLRGGLAFAKEPYLHPLRIPLAQAVRQDEAELGADGQSDGFGNECEGHCAV